MAIADHQRVEQLPQLPADRADEWWEEMTMKTQLRIAASVCVLSTGLMIGSAGGAVADTGTGTGGSSAGGQGTAGSNSSPGPASPIKSIADTLRKTVQDGLQGFSGTLNTLTKQGQLPSLVSTSPKSTVSASPTVHGSTGSITPPPADPAPSPSDDTPPPTGNQNAPTAPNPAAAVSLAASNAASAASNAASNAAAAAASAAAAAASAAQAASNAASNIITTAAETVAVPVNQVITSVQDVITSVSNAGVALSQLPTDLSDLLGVSAAVQSTTAVGTASHLLSPSADPVATTLFAPSAPISGLPGGAGVLAPTAPLGPVTPLDFTAQARDDAASTAAQQPASSDARASDVLSMVEHVIGAFVASVSLTALLAVALPGLAALFGTCVAGIRFGYRQAKAGAELPDTAVSRFVGSGPVGVVRSGTQIALRARIARSDRPAGEQPVRARTLRLVRPASASAELLDHAV
jgi:hypothetical protein